MTSWKLWMTSTSHLQQANSQLKLVVCYHKFEIYHKISTNGNSYRTVLTIFLCWRLRSKGYEGFDGVFRNHLYKTNNGTSLHKSKNGKLSDEFLGCTLEVFSWGIKHNTNLESVHDMRAFLCISSLPPIWHFHQISTGRNCYRTFLTIFLRWRLRRKGYEGFDDVFRNLYLPRKKLGIAYTNWNIGEPGTTAP